MERTAEHAGTLIGLTGPTGAGKTVVSSLLGSMGYRVIDADVVARQVVEKGRQCLLDLAVEFGIEILNSDGTLNRRRLGDIVFADRKKRLTLNRITHPYIQEEIFSGVEALHAEGVRIVFLDAPTLLESGSHRRCDKVVSVLAPREERLYRIIERDHLTHQSAENRMKSQHDDEYYISRSDYVIQNGGDMNDLREQVIGMLRAVLPEQERVT